MLTNKSDKTLYTLSDLVLTKAPHLQIVSTLLELIEDIRMEKLKVLVNWHPLGFLQFKLAKFENENSLKLHIWDEKTRLVQHPAWLVHRHEWDLTSHVLAGEVTNFFFQVDPVTNNQKDVKRIYNVSFEGQNSILERTEELVSCKYNVADRYKSGRKYDVYSSQYHSSIVDDSMLASTIIVSTQKVISNPTVLGDKDGNDMYVYNREICEIKTWNPILEKLNKLLLLER